jgi:hypothetical protein
MPGLVPRTHAVVRAMMKEKPTAQGFSATTMQHHREDARD